MFCFFFFFEGQCGFTPIKLPAVYLFISTTKTNLHHAEREPSVLRPLVFLIFVTRALFSFSAETRNCYGLWRRDRATGRSFSFHGPYKNKPALHYNEISSMFISVEKGNFIVGPRQVIKFTGCEIAVLLPVFMSR